VKNRTIQTRFLCQAAILWSLLGLISNATAQQPLLPNLVALPAFDISAGLNGGGKPELRFAFRSWNAGAGPMELISGEVAQGRQNIYQRIYDDAGGYADRLAGNFEWHQGHNHFHFDDYALYVLPGVRGNSQRTSAKTSFCLMDTAPEDLTLPGAPSSAVYSSCGNFFQGISVGWGDTYGAHLIGQEISLHKVKDGDYRLMTTVDPFDRILESDETDNESCVLLRITTSTATPSVQVLDPNGCDGGEPPPPPPPGEEVIVSGIDPNSGAPGDSVLVTITGSGFTNGMEVSLENGSGARPTVSIVGRTFSDTTDTIDAWITLKNGAKAVSWDVRVGSGVLAGGFTVTAP
jgi:hypothetical protein